MQVTAVWPNCDASWLDSEVVEKHVDAFWIEVASVSEENRLLRLASRDLHLEPLMRSLLRRNDRTPYLCFLVARDGRFVRPMHYSYPCDNQWNAYSPFRYVKPVSITDIKGLLDFVYELLQEDQ